MVDEFEKSQSRSERFSRFVRSAAFRPEVKGYKEAAEELERARKIPELKRKIKETSKRGEAVALAFRHNGPGLPADTYLRNFLAEYNGRVFFGEGINQPSSWNVLRAFVEPDEIGFVLRLLPEMHFSLDLDTVLERITRPDFEVEWSDLKRLEELKIYNVNFYGGPIPLGIGNKALGLSSISVVRDQNELSLMAVLGERAELERNSKMPVDRSQIWPGKEFIVEGKEEIDVSDIPLLDDETHRPLIILMRVDLSDGTLQVRYGMEEKSDVFNVYCDDPDTILSMLNMPNYEGFRDASLSGVAKLADVMEVLVQIPKFLLKLDEFDDDLIDEKHPTQIRLKSTSSEVKKAKRILSAMDVPNYVRVQVLPPRGAHHTFEVSPSGLKIERRGYWKTLPLDQAGTDLSGRQVQGKSWVSEQTSWFEAPLGDQSSKGSAIEVRLEDGDDEGYVYVLRNAQHPRDTYKVGYTTKLPDERAAQLSRTTGQPDSFAVVQEWHVRAPKKIEAEIHRRLKMARVNNSREFFSAKYREIRQCIEAVIEEAKAEI